MTLYLDNSFLNRPFDNPDIRMNKLEAEVLFLIIDLADKDEVQLITSSTIEYENSLNPFPERKAFVAEVLAQTKTHQNINQEIEKRAKHLVQQLQLDSIDSLHLATAEYYKVDLFITCDYNLVKKYKGNSRNNARVSRKATLISIGAAFRCLLKKIGKLNTRTACFVYHF